MVKINTDFHRRPLLPCYLYQYLTRAHQQRATGKPHLLAARERRLEKVGVQILARGHVLQPHTSTALYRLSGLARQGAVRLLDLSLRARRCGQGRIRRRGVLGMLLVFVSYVGSLQALNLPRRVKNPQKLPAYGISHRGGIKLRATRSGKPSIVSTPDFES